MNNNKRVFLVNKSDISGRLDPSYLYNTLFSKRKYKYNTLTLQRITKTLTGGTPSKEVPSYWNGDIPWISPKDMKEFYIERSEDTITELGLINSSTKLVPNRSVLLVVRSGILTHTLPVAINKLPVAINQDIKVLIPNNCVIPEYLGYYLHISSDYILPLIVKHSTTVQSVNTLELDRLQIPIPPMNVQQDIVDLMNTAYAKKQNKEIKALRLLGSIDEYLLSELGIQQPATEDSLHSRIFTTTFKDVTGSRLDPKLYDVNTQNLKAAIERSCFHKTSLRSIIIHSRAGDWGLEETEEIEGGKYQKCLVIRATEFDNKYNLDLDNSRVKYRLINKSKLSKMNICENDLLIEKSGGSPDQPVGRVAILSQDIIKNNTICYSNFIHKIRIDKKQAVPMYVFSFLKTLHNIKLTEAMQSQTNGIRNLIMNTYLSQTIILPPLEKQTEIANNIKSFREQAKKLQTEASAIIEMAKKRVEQMLLDDKQ